MTLVAALAAASLAGFLLALWSIRRVLAERAEEEAGWAALDDRSDVWP